MSSLLKYFKPITKSTGEVIESSNVLNNVTSIEREEIAKQLNEDKSKKRKKYRVWKPEERGEIGKLAAERGNKSALLHLKAKYPGLTRQTVSDFSKAYRELKSKNKDLEVTSIEKKKTGRPSILPDDLMEKTIQTIDALRLKGAPVSSVVVNAVAKGIVIANDRSILTEYGGYLTLSNDWARKVLYKMETMGRKMTRRMATTSKAPIAPGVLKEIKLDFQRKIKQLQSLYEIPDDLILNFDQTPLPYVCSSNHTLHEKGASSVPIVGKGKKKQITGTFTVSKSGNFLPPQLIYEGKTDRCLPKGVAFPEDFDTTYTSNHWSNEEKAIQHVERIVIPYLKKKREELKLPSTQKALLIFDVFKGQTTAAYQEVVESNDCVIVFVPANMTNHFQPLDLTVNGPAKQFLKQKFESWYAIQITEQFNKGKNVYDVEVPLKLSVLKPIHANWLIGLYDYMRNNQDMIRKGFEEAGINEALSIELEPEDPFHDLD